MKTTLKIGLGQFFVQPDWQQNLSLCCRLIERAEAAGVDLLVLPEGIIARKPGFPGWSAEHAQSLDGPFVSGLLQATQGRRVTVVATVHTPVSDQSKVHNDLIAVAHGQLLLTYTKLHLYDAFSGCESDRVAGGDAVPSLLDIGAFRVGFMTCYDVRFPELARRLACDGATLLVLPAAWVRGPLKEMHWDLAVRARALENTCYVAAVSECGPVNVGQSKVVDPQGLVIAQAGTDDQLLVCEIDQQTVVQVRERLPVLVNRRFAVPQLRSTSEP